MRQSQECKFISSFVEGDSGAVRGLDGQHGVQYKFIEDLKRGTKLRGKLCYLTRSVQENYFECVLKLPDSLFLSKSYFCMILIIFSGISSIYLLESVSVISPMNSSPGEVRL